MHDGHPDLVDHVCRTLLRPNGLWGEVLAACERAGRYDPSKVTDIARVRLLALVIEAATETRDERRLAEHVGDAASALGRAMFTDHGALALATGKHFAACGDTRTAVALYTEALRKRPELADVDNNQLDEWDAP